MRKFAEKSPIVFEIILVIAAFALALAFGLPCRAASFDNELSMAIGRILAGILMLLIFRRCFDFSKPAAGATWQR